MKFLDFFQLYLRSAGDPKIYNFWHSWKLDINDYIVGENYVVLLLHALFLVLYENVQGQILGSTWL